MHFNPFLCKEIFFTSENHVKSYNFCMLALVTIGMCSCNWPLYTIHSDVAILNWFDLLRNMVPHRDKSYHTIFFVNNSDMDWLEVLHYVEFSIYKLYFYSFFSIKNLHQYWFPFGDSLNISNLLSNY